jgi:hypothetical protein
LIKMGRPIGGLLGRPMAIKKEKKEKKERK